MGADVTAHGTGERGAKGGHSLLELVVVLAVLGVLAGVGLAGAKGIRAWLARGETRALFLELQTACRLCRHELGGWPEALAGGEIALNGEGPDWRAALAPYLERPVHGCELADGHGNTRLFLLVDADDDHWIEPAEFRALAPEERPPRLWERAAVYSLDADGRLAAASWQ